MILWLIGYRGTGKTTVGRLLAESLGREFADADAALIRETGESIAEFVAREGWPAFRRAESRILRKLSMGTDRVVATGGGVVLDPENVRRMRATGTVIWLTARPETILSRLSGDPATEANRPALTDQSAEAEIRTTLAEREPLYAAAAHRAVATDRADASEIAGDIRRWVFRLREKG